LTFIRLNVVEDFEDYVVKFIIILWWRLMTMWMRLVMSLMLILISSPLIPINASFPFIFTYHHCEDLLVLSRCRHLNSLLWSSCEVLVSLLTLFPLALFKVSSLLFLHVSKYLLSLLLLLSEDLECSLYLHLN